MGETKMSETTTYTNLDLRIEVQDKPDTIEVIWYGKSDQRNPTQFLVPILLDVLKKGIADNKLIIWNLRELEYMNSSGITPIIKGLEQAKKNPQNKVKVLYSKSKKWQDLSFSALRIFQTQDRRVELITD